MIVNEFSAATLVSTTPLQVIHILRRCFPTGPLRVCATAASTDRKRWSNLKNVRAETKLLFLLASPLRDLYVLLAPN
jgi:hypothetical protein